MYWQSLWFRDPATGLPAAGSFYQTARNACPKPGPPPTLALRIPEVPSVSTNIDGDQEHDDIIYPQVVPSLVGVMIVVPTLTIVNRASSQLLRESSPVTYRLRP